MTIVLPIVQGVVYAASNGPVFLGTTLSDAMRSRPLVDLLHKAGHIQLRANPQVGHLTSAIN